MEVIAEVHRPSTNATVFDSFLLANNNQMTEDKIPPRNLSEYTSRQQRRPSKKPPPPISTTKLSSKQISFRQEGLSSLPKSKQFLVSAIPDYTSNPSFLGVPSSFGSKGIGSELATPMLLSPSKQRIDIPPPQWELEQIKEDDLKLENIQKELIGVIPMDYHDLKALSEHVSKLTTSLGLGIEYTHSSNQNMIEEEEDLGLSQSNVNSPKKDSTAHLNDGSIVDDIQTPVTIEKLEYNLSNLQLPTSKSPTEYLLYPIRKIKVCY
jgi:hypothetical protein